uniref:Uncharacterized protein n=1 Tax=Sciurus vulgaris TaxID=55149 RepID=A0A8D2DN33_SCIVU
MWCAPKLDAPHATPRRPLRVSGTIQSRARRPPAPLPPLPPPPGEPSSALHRSILWYMAGRPPRGSRRGRQSLGREERRGRRGAGAQGGLRGRPPHRARAPILSLLRTVFSGSWSLPCLAPQTIRNIAEANAAGWGLVRKSSPGEQQARRGWLLPDFQGSRFSRDTPKEFRARVRAGGWGAGKLFKAPPGGSSLLHDSHPPRVH